MSPNETADFHIETHLPKPWEQEQTFNDVLYEWMSRAPWLAISAAAHLLVFFILAAIPWEQFRKKDTKTIQATIEAPPEEIFEEPEEEPEEIVEEEVIEEPVLQDSEVVEEITEVVESSDTDIFSHDLSADQFDNVLGIGQGGAGGGKYGRRVNRGQIGGGRGIEQALKDGLDWLKAHQSPGGYWDVDGFMANCGEIGSSTCSGAGDPQHDVGITALALLAFLGEGNTTNEGRYQDVVKEAVKWLREQQDPDSGLIGERSSRDFIYDHAIASLALCEAYYFSKSPLLKRSAQKAVDFIHLARNPYGAWRYDVPPIGENDTSVTGWMVLALTSARDAGLAVDPDALDGALLWIDEVTDPATGRVGYAALGTMSSRTKANDHFPPEKGEAMTAVGLLCRFFLKQAPDEFPIMERHAEVLLRTPPRWDVEGFGCDMYYWYYGSYAMFQFGGKYWSGWRDKMEPAVLESQRKDGDEKGSWDPIGPWGYVGGRVYSTALMVLCLEVYFRYGRVLGAR